MFRRIGDHFRNFMMGRYGQDQLGTAIFGVGLVLTILSMVFGRFAWSTIISLLSWTLLIWCIFRMYSKNISARSEENRKFLRLFARAKDRQHCYFSCPECRQKVRVPRGRGKISITCPKCANKFIKKT